MELDDDLGDLSLDDVFPNPELTSTTASTTSQVAEPTQTQVASEPFMKTSSGTVYKTVEDAIKGTEHKDELIRKLREQAIAQTGIDPVTNQPVRQQQQNTQQYTNYTQDPDRFLKDLTDAAESKDTKAYVRVQQKLVEDTMSPYANLIADFSKMKAVEQVTSEIPDFRDFLKSEDYQKTLDENVPLKTALSVAEANPAHSGDLAQFYKMAYKLNAADRKLPQALRAQTQTQTVRPTVTSTATLPPPSNGMRHEQPSLATSEGRKALLAQMDTAGIGNTRF